MGKSGSEEEEKEEEEERKKMKIVGFKYSSNEGRESSRVEYSCE